MPKFQSVKNSRHGDFFLKFKKDAPKQNFYGQQLSQVQIFRRYGNMPDNGILANKIINKIGKNLLNLEEQKLKLADRKGLSSEVKAEIEHYSAMERESNAFAASVIESLSFLEKDRFSPKDKKDKQTIGDISGENKHKVTDLYDSRLQNLNKKIIGLMPAKNGREQIKIQRYQALYKRVQQNKAETLAQLNNPDTRLDAVYQKVMDQFSHEQQDISSYQLKADKALDYKNDSMTQAYNNSCSVIQDHVFSVYEPTPDQLWQMDESSEHDSVIDSRNYPSMPKESAILAAAIIDPPQGKTVLAQVKEQVNDVKQASKTKKELDGKPVKLKGRLGRNKQTYEEAKKNKPPQALVAVPKEAIAKPELALFQKLKNIHDNEVLSGAGLKKHPNYQALKDVHANDTPVPEGIDLKDPDVIKIQQLILKEADQEFCKDSKMIAREGAVYLAHSSDFYSALGNACADFGKYFEREMASKNPMSTGAFFVSAVATFGAAGMAQGGSAMAQGAYNSMTQLLTAGGHAGFSSAQLQSGINAVIDETMILTHCSGGFEAFLLTSFVLPKMNFLLLDSVVNGFESKDLLSQLGKSFDSQDLEHYSQEERDKILREQAAFVAVLLGAAVTLGIGAHLLAGMHAAGAKLTGEMLSEAMNVPPDTFTSLFATPSALNDFLALASAILTIKTAGIFLGKGMLLLSHMKSDDVTPDQKQAYILMCTLREKFEVAPEECRDLIASMGEDMPYYKTQFEALMDKNPEIKELFGNDFLSAANIGSAHSDKLEQILGNDFDDNQSQAFNWMCEQYTQFKDSPKVFEQFLKDNAGDIPFYVAHFEDLMDKDPRIEELFDSDFLSSLNVTKNLAHSDQFSEDWQNTKDELFSGSKPWVAAKLLFSPITLPIFMARNIHAGNAVLTAGDKSYDASKYFVKNILYEGIGKKFALPGVLGALDMATLGSIRGILKSNTLKTIASALGADESTQLQLESAGLKMEESSLNMRLGLANLVIMFNAGIKTLGIPIIEAAKVSLMLATELVSNAALVVPFIFKDIVKGYPSPLRMVGGLVASPLNAVHFATIQIRKLVLPVLMTLTEVSNFALNVGVKWPVLAVATIGDAILGTKSADRVSEIAKSVYENGGQFFKDILTSRTEVLNNMLETAPGGATVVGTKDDATTSVGQFFNKLGNGLSKGFASPGKGILRYMKNRLQDIDKRKHEIVAEAKQEVASKEQVNAVLANPVGATKKRSLPTGSHDRQRGMDTTEAKQAHSDGHISVGPHLAGSHMPGNANNAQILMQGAPKTSDDAVSPVIETVKHDSFAADADEKEDDSETESEGRSNHGPIGH